MASLEDIGNLAEFFPAMSFCPFSSTVPHTVALSKGARAPFSPKVLFGVLNQTVLPWEDVQKALAAPANILFSNYEISKKFDDTASLDVTVHSK